jgi:hypothetical protein
MVPVANAPPPVTSPSPPAADAAPRRSPRPLRPLPAEPEVDWAPALLSVGLAAFFAALGYFGESAIAYATAALFTILFPILAAMNLTARRS